MKSCKFAVLGVLLLAGLLVWPASAELYKYRDADGNLRITDDINMVPEDQRESSDRYTEYASPPEPDTTDAPEPAKPAGVAVDKKTADELNAVREKLDVRVKALNAEFEALKAESDALDEERQNLKSNEITIKKFNRKAEALNEKWKAYEQKRKALDADVSAYNERVKALSGEAESGQ